MSGKSAREKEAEKLQGQISGFQPTVQNRFGDNYTNPFGFEDVSSKLEDVFGGYENIINRDTAEEIAGQQGGAASNLASRGITGGSVLTDTQSKIASDINKSKTNALSRLGIGKAGGIADLMQYFNQNKLATTKAATDVDFGNIDNLFQKFGLQGNALNYLDDSTTLDDIFSGLSTIAPIAAAPFTGGTSLLGYLLGGSGTASGAASGGG